MIHGKRFVCFIYCKEKKAYDFIKKIKKYYDENRIYYEYRNRKGNFLRDEIEIRAEEFCISTLTIYSSIMSIDRRFRESDYIIYSDEIYLKQFGEEKDFEIINTFNWIIGKYKDVVITTEDSIFEMIKTANRLHHYSYD